MNDKISILRYNDFPTTFHLIPYIWHYKFELLNIVYIKKYFKISVYFFLSVKYFHIFSHIQAYVRTSARNQPSTYLESTLQHPIHKIRKAPSRSNFSYLSGNFSSCVTYNVMVNITIIQQKPQNFQERQKRRDRFLCGVMVYWIHIFMVFVSSWRVVVKV